MNIDEDDFTIFHLAKSGYATIKDLREMDTTEFLDLVEFEQISNDIELRHIQDSER
tara:strand:+ start:407 stop:574 length:168 start_codon:yes stop_codon:yes gene_type:complete